MNLNLLAIIRSVFRRAGNAMGLMIAATTWMKLAAPTSFNLKDYSHNRFVASSCYSITNEYYSHVIFFRKLIDGFDFMMISYTEYQSFIIT